MKKHFKFTSVALGLLILTSCNSDDFLGSSKANLKGEAVLDVTVMGSEGLTTRGFKGDDKDDPVVWANGDKVRLYDDRLYSSATFTYSEAEGNFVNDEQTTINKTNVGYAVYAESEKFSYSGWNEAANAPVVLVQLGDVAGEGKIQYAQTSAEGNVHLYKEANPYWGTAKYNTDKGIFEARVQRMAGQVKVTFKNGAVKNVSEVRVRALHLKEGADKTKLVKGEPVPEEFLGGDNSVVLDDTDHPLSGWFEAVLDETDILPTPDSPLSNIKNAVLKKITKDESNPIEPGNSTSISVMLDKDTEWYTKESVVYVPIITTLNGDDDKYDVLMIEYKEGEIWKYAGRQENYKMLVGSTVSSTITAKTTSDATTLHEVNKFLSGLDIEDDLSIDFTNKVASFTVGDDSQLTGSYRDTALVIPATWPAGKTVTLNFYGADGDAATGLVTAGGPAPNWTVKHKVTGEVYNNVTIQPVPMEIKNNSGANIVINTFMGKNSPRDVEVIVTQNDGTVTLGENINTINAKKGSIVVDASNTTTKKVNVTTEGEYTSIDVVGGTVETLTHSGTGDITIINGGKVNTLTNNGKNAKITIENGLAVALTNSAESGEIDVKSMSGNGTTWVDNSSEALTINANGKNIYQLTTAGTEVTLDELMIGGTLTLEGEDAQVKAADCKVNEVVCNGSATYHTTGLSSVLSAKEGNTAYGSVTGEHKLVFSSDWDGENYEEIVYYGNQKKTVSTPYDVYTAAELALLLNNLSQDIEINLYAKTINLGTDNLWTGITNRSLTKTVKDEPSYAIKLNGNGGTITNVNIANTEAQMKASRDYGINGWGFIRVAGNVEVSNLTLTGVNTNNLERYSDIAKVFNKKELLMSIGGLVGEQQGTGKYTNVTINGSNIGYQYEGDETEEQGEAKNNAIGGLIGQAYKGNTDITDCTVNLTGKISGTWSLGGLVGHVESADMTFKNNSVEVGGFDVRLALSDGEQYGRHFGQVGMLIGSLNGEGCAVSITENDKNDAGKDYTGVKNCIVGERKNLKFDLCQHVVKVTNGYANETFYGLELKGKSGQSTVYVGYSDDFDQYNLKVGAEGKPVVGAGTLTLKGKLENQTKGTDVTAFNVFNPTPDVSNDPKFVKKH